MNTPHKSPYVLTLDFSLNKQGNLVIQIRKEEIVCCVVLSLRQPQSTRRILHS